MSRVTLTWSEIVSREVVTSVVWRRALVVTAAVVLTVLSAFVRIPLPGNPVPVTLQTFVVLLSGALLGRRLGAVSQGIYVGLGSAGLPVFTGAASGFFLGLPTGGYLLAFVVVGWVLGALLADGQRRSLLVVLGSMALASVIIYLLGATHLAVVVGLGPRQAIALGVLPFLIGDTLKIVAAAALYRRLAPLLRKRLEL